MATALLPSPPAAWPPAEVRRPAGITPLADWQSQRFRAFFPYSSRVVLSPMLTGAAAAIVALVFFGLGNQTAGLAVVAIWTGLLMVYMSRPFLSTYLFAPMGYLGIRQIMTFGLGLFFYSLEVPDAASPAMQAMQLDAIVAALSRIAGFLLVFRAYTCLYMPLENAAYERNVLRPLSTIGFLSMAFVFVSTVILFFARGGGDRALKTAVYLDEALGWWSALQLFPGIGYMIWFIAPLMWRLSGFPGRAFLILAAITIVGGGTLSGGRGALLYPILYAMAGFFSFAKRPRNLDVWMVGFMALLIPFVVFWAFLRGSAAFRDSRLTDLPSRVDAIGKAYREYQERKASDDIEKGIFGAHLLGNQDLAIYTRTPVEIPHAGFANIANPINAILPTFIYRNKEQVADGNAILVAYTNRPVTHTGLFLSFSGDLYRRFGHIGVPIGNFIAAAAFAAIMNGLYAFYFRGDATLGLALIVFLGTSPGFGLLEATVNEYMVNWLFWVPKHIVFLVAAYMATHVLTPFVVRGAAAYLPRPAAGG